jgi:hypothetical protein
LANNSFSAFVRHPNGKFTTFTVAGAGTGANQGTIPYSINPKGEITGYYVDGSNVCHGYVRLSDGTITSIDVPGAGTGAGQGTFALNINAEGEIAGEYVDANNVSHGFVLVLGPGRFTSFDAPGAGTGPGQGTETASEDGLTRKGALAGGYIDGSTVVHGLVLLADGTMTTFDVTGAGAGAGTGTYQGTYPGGIDPKNTILDTTLTGTTCITASSAVRMAPSPPLTFRARARRPARAPRERTSARVESTDNTLTGTTSITASYIITAPSARSTLPAPGQGTFIGGPIIAYGERGHPRGEEFAGYYVDQNNVLHGYLATIAPPPGPVDAAR